MRAAALSINVATERCKHLSVIRGRFLFPRKEKQKGVGGLAIIRKLNHRAASLPLASLVSLDSFALLHPPQAALGSLTPCTPTNAKLVVRYAHKGTPVA